MPLPKTTQDRILADADKFAFVVPYDGSNKFYNDDLLKGYIAGASAENERAQKLVEALEKIANNTAWQNWQAQEIAKSALQQWNAGNEVEG